MITEIIKGVLWDDTKPLNQQQKEAQQLIEDATEGPVLRHESETCLANQSRLIQSEYQLTEKLLLQASFIYNSDPLERDFMGLNNIYYTIIPISNGA